jgi:hypothetical protein
VDIPTLEIPPSKPRLCSICKKDGCRISICPNCKTCFKPPGECGFQAGAISTPCGTDPEELAVILSNRQDALNKLKSESKKRRGDSKEASRLKRRNIEEVASSE